MLLIRHRCRMPLAAHKYTGPRFLRETGPTGGPELGTGRPQGGGERETRNAPAVGLEKEKRPFEVEVEV